MDPPENLYPQFTAEKVRHRSSGSHQDISESLLSGAIQSNLTKMVWDASRTQVKQVFSLYTNIDLFRPYFDVEPKRVRNQLILSLIPQKPSSMQKLTSDLYAPVMLLFTLIALLLYAMKTSNYYVQDGTLIGAAMFTCFGYWFFVSMAIYTMCYIFLTSATLLQTFSLVGYALFGNCIIFGLTLFIDAFAHSHTIFYLLFALFGLAPAVRIGIFFMSRTPGKTRKFIIGPAIIFMHCSFLLYLHYGFHEIIEEIVEMMGESGMVTIVEEIVKNSTKNIY